MNGGASLWLSLRFPPDEEGFTFAADAGVANLEVATLNSILLPIEGVEDRGGRLDSLTFSIRVRGGGVPLRHDRPAGGARHHAVGIPLAASPRG